MMDTRSLRFRMMVLFSAVVGALLAGSYLSVLALLYTEVRVQLDRQLVEIIRPVMADLIAEPEVGDINQLNLPNQYFEVLDPSGKVLQQSVNLRGKNLGLSSGALDSAQTTFKTIEGGDRGRLRVILAPFRQGTEQVFLALAVPLRGIDRVLESFGTIIMVLAPLSLLLTAAFSAWYVGRALAPITALTQRAEQMAERVSSPERRKLWTPLVVKRPDDELGRLAETFNRMAAGVDTALSQLRQFVSDASHELRTPLAVLQGETELVLSQPRSAEEYVGTLHTIDDELKKLSRIVQGLFTLSMADAGQLRLARDPLYLNEVLDEACALILPRAQAKKIAIQPELSQEVPYLGDEAFLRQLFLIFLDNAVKYSPPRTSVKVKLAAEDGIVRAVFEDQGMGIPKEEQQRIFERFYRGFQAGPDEGQSGGLGLAIAQAIARSQGGSVECESTPGVGSTFTVTLPMVRPNGTSPDGPASD
jgi:two-component system, OmpR family, sensor kinase